MSHTYNIRVTIKDGKQYYYDYYYDVYHKRHQVMSRTKEGVIKKINNAEKRKLLGIDEGETKFGVFVQRHLELIHFKDLKPKSKEIYMSVYKNYIKHSVVAEYKMSQITVEMLQCWYDQIFDEKGRARVKAIDRIIRPSLRFAFANGNISKDYTKFLKVKKDSAENRLKRQMKSNVRPLTLDEQLLFIEEIKGDDYEALYRMAIDGGYRRGELLALTWNDLDFVNNRIHINKTYSIVKDPTEKDAKYKGVIETPKSLNSIRTNKMPAVLKQILMQHKAKQKDYFLQLGIDQDNSTLVFTNGLKSFLCPTTVTKKIKKVYEALGIDTNKTFHDLRHTYATRQFEMGTEILVVSKLLGHSSPRETIKTYIHILNNLKDATADATDELYANLYQTK